MQREHPTVYRVHENPDPDKLRAFAQFARPFGYRIDPSKPEDTAQFQVVLRGAKNDPKQRVLPTLLLRSLARARYADECIGHYGLKAKFYLHFTSPIRRYPDLVVHHMLKALLFGRSELHDQEASALRWLGRHCSEREREADAAARESQELKLIELMESQVGGAFSGVVSGVAPYGLYVRLDNTAEGLLPVRRLGTEVLLARRRTAPPGRPGQQQDVEAGPEGRGRPDAGGRPPPCARVSPCG